MSLDITDIRIGDTVTCINAEYSNSLVYGKEYVVRGIESTYVCTYICIDDDWHKYRAWSSDRFIICRRAHIEIPPYEIEL